MSTDTPQYHVVPRRTFSLWLLLVVVAAGAATMVSVSALRARARQLEVLAQWNVVDAAQETAILLRIVVTPVLIAVATMALYLALVGSRTIIEKSSPPPGSWILEGTPVKTGRTAVRLGWVMLALSLLLLASSLYGLEIAWVGVPHILLG